MAVKRAEAERKRESRYEKNNRGDPAGTGSDKSERARKFHDGRLYESALKIHRTNSKWPNPRDQIPTLDPNVDATCRR